MSMRPTSEQEIDSLRTERDGLLAEVERLRSQLAEAWDEGYHNGYSIGYADDPDARTNYENPYREAAS